MKFKKYSIVQEGSRGNPEDCQSLLTQNVPMCLHVVIVVVLLRGRVGEVGEDGRNFCHGENERVTASNPAAPILDPDLRVHDIIRWMPYQPVSASYPLLMALVGWRPSFGRCHSQPGAGSCSSQQNWHVLGVIEENREYSLAQANPAHHGAIKIAMQCMLWVHVSMQGFP